MSARNSNDSSWGRRKSLFALTALKSSSDFTHRSDGASTKLPKTLIKKHKQQHIRTPSLRSDIDHPDVAREDNAPSRPLSDQPVKPRARRPSLSMKVSRRPPSVFESLKNSVRGSSEELMGMGMGNGYTKVDHGEPLSATSSKAPSLSFENAVMEAGNTTSRTVIQHGEVQTSAGMFRKKKEYLVLTDHHIVRYKSQAKAAEIFRTIASAAGRSPASRHGSMPSAGSQSDLQTVSDSSGDKDGRVPLRQVVATHKLDDGKPYFALEVCYLDEESGQASAMTLQFNNPEERDMWLCKIRYAVAESRLQPHAYISPYNLENAARIVERDNDYDPWNCAIFKVVQRQPAAKSSSRSSSDDLTKVASTVCFLAVGVHKIHLIQLTKPAARSSSPSLSAPQSQCCYGILTLSALQVSNVDDTFDLTFRQPLQKARTLHLASAASHEIAARLCYSENYLRPECGHRLFRLIAPVEVENLLVAPVQSDVEEHACLDRTLIAYCVAYGVNPANVRYTLEYNCEDAPQFVLLPPADSRRPNYGPLELLAIMRALRYNESFGSLSLANIPLDSLNGLHDNYGQELVCTRTKRGTPIKMPARDLAGSSLLVQEVRALAAASKRYRRMDFSNCITSKHAAPDPTDDEPSRMKDIGCGIVEALFPLCKSEITNVDWICLNGIELSETDLDYLVASSVERKCHFRAIELNRCGLNDRSLGLVLDALRAQENTLESLDIAGNAFRINPSAFDSQIGMFGFIRKMDLSNVSRTSGAEPFLRAETLLIWRLEELRLSGTSLNENTIDAISTYLAHPQSNSLQEFRVDNTYLSGADVATLLHSMSYENGEVRSMHLDISQCLLTKGLENVTRAISDGKTPTHLTMKAIEYREEAQFRKVITALTGNRSLQFLDMSQTGLPGDVGDETCRALSRLFAENTSLIELDVSGDDSRLATSKFGPGINEALAGLKQNTTMRVFRIEKQKLGFQGASTLAEVLRANRTLLELHCDNNDIPLHGLTDLVNSLVDNTSLVHLPTMTDGRLAAFKSAEATMKVMADLESPTSPSQTNSSSFGSTSAVKRGLSHVKKTTQRATSSMHSPSFPNLPSANRSTSSLKRTHSPLSINLPPTRFRHGRAPSMIAPPGFTVQDIQTTHRLLSEQWDRQCFRLEQYLHRNWCLHNNVPVDLQIEDEKFERPSSVGSIGKLLEQVKYDTTPKAEKDHYFDSPQDISAVPGSPLHQATPIDSTKNSLSLQQFILESGPQTSSLQDELNLEERARQLRLDTNIDKFEEPRTPTQKAFSLAPSIQ